MTIRPDNNVLELWINPYNPTPYVHSFLFFANPSVHVDPTYQVIFPPSVEWVTQHAKREFLSWPIANGRYGDKDYENVDISWWKNLPKARMVGKVDRIARHKSSGLVYVFERKSTSKNLTDSTYWDRLRTDDQRPEAFCRRPGGLVFGRPLCSRRWRARSV